MKGREIATGADSLLDQTSAKQVPVLTIEISRQLDYISEPADSSVIYFQIRRQNIRAGCEFLLIQRSQLLPARDDAFNAAELLEAESTIDVGKAIAVSIFRLLEPIERRVAALIAQLA